MSRLHFTDLSIRALKPPERGQVTHWDDSLRGFGIRVSQGGTKTWVVMHGEERKRTSLGRYPGKSLQDARGEAKRLLTEPAKTGSGAGIAFEDALSTFISTHCAVKNKPGTAKETERLLRRHFLPAFKRCILEEISTDDFHGCCRSCTGNTGGSAARVHGGTNIFPMGNTPRLIKHSPVDGLQLPTKSVARDRVLSEAELARIYSVARRRGHPFGTIVELLILTGQRRGEIGALQHAYIDSAAKVITLPASLTKNGREHTFPYGELVARTLNAARPTATCCSRRAAQASVRSTAGRRASSRSIANVGSTTGRCMICAGRSRQFKRGSERRRTSPSAFSITKRER